MSEIALTQPQQNQLLPLLQMQPAQTLAEVYRTMATRPLVTEQERQAFYRDMNAVRGGDKIAHIKRDLEREHGISYFKGFFMGHSGVGKSTEIKRLEGMVESKFRILRIHATDDLNGADFRPFDVLFVIILRLTEALSRLEAQDKIPAELLDALYQWFRTSEYTEINEREGTISETKEAGMPKKLSELFGLVFNISNSLRFLSKRQNTTTEYSYKTMGQLIDLMNRLFVAANLQIQAEGKEWVVIGEDFDKRGVSPARVEELFIEHANIFTSLQIHLIFNIPSALAYSEKAQELPKIHRYSIFDTPVYTRKHQPDTKGRDALREVMDARVNPALFAERQQERLIVASGGNLTELFVLTVAAADNAAVRSGEEGHIEEEDVTRAINERRREYRNALGSSPYDPNPIPYTDKAKRLVAVYYQEPDHKVPDRVLYTLIVGRAVQEFNGISWFSVHPLIVDQLIEDKRLKPNDTGTVPGGTI